MVSSIHAVHEGRDLLDALAEVFPEGEGWVHASGYVENVELRLPSSDGDVRRSLSGRYVLAQLSGPRSGPYGVTLARAQGSGTELVAGILVRARSSGITVFLASPADTARPVSTTPPEVMPAFPESIQQSSAADDDDEIYEPERGDLIDHFAFGLCEVLNASGDRLMIRDVTRGGRVREIRTHLLVVHPPAERDGKRVFRLTRRG